MFNFIKKINIIDIIANLITVFFWVLTIYGIIYLIYYIYFAYDYIFTSIYKLIYKLFTNNKEDFVVEPPPADIPDDSGTCGYKNDIVKTCINYTSCCGSSKDTSNDCVCGHPMIQDCRKKFEACKKNNTTNKEIMNRCIAENKNCCRPYNSISIYHNNFKPPILNEPTTSPFCKVTNVPKLPQKCMELCQTNSKCKAYSIKTGTIVQDSGDCNLFDTVSIVDTSNNPDKKAITGTYYIKK